MMMMMMMKEQQQQRDCGLQKVEEGEEARQWMLLPLLPLVVLAF